MILNIRLKWMNCLAPSSIQSCESVLGIHDIILSHNDDKHLTVRDIATIIMRQSTHHCLISFISIEGCPTCLPPHACIIPLLNNENNILIISGEVKGLKDKVEDEGTTTTNAATTTAATSSATVTTTTTATTTTSDVNTPIGKVKVPVIILTGFLGAGKTTMVCAYIMK